jgi:subtilisin family serine protease
MHRKPGINELPIASGDPLWPLEFIDIRFEPHDPLFDGEVELPRRERRRKRKPRALAPVLALSLLLEASACGGRADEPHALALHATDSVLVQLAPGAVLPAPLLDDGSGPPIRALAAIGPDGEAPLLRIPVPPEVDVTEAARKLALQPGVAFAEPVYLYKTARTPNDPRLKDLWGMSRIDAPEAWQQTTGDRKVVVAVVDDGLATTHPDLAANLWSAPPEQDAWSFNDDGADFGRDRWHGTHVAGIIGAVGDNQLGVTGVNWSVSLMGLPAFGPDGGRSDVLARAIDYAADHGARVVTAAWSGGGRSLAIEHAIARAGARGVLVVAAAGNDGASEPAFPASLALDNLISVGASGPDDLLAPFSNRGAMVAAPGVGILSTTAPGRYERYDGTSMAAAHVAGLAALLWAARPHAPVARIRQAILASGSVIDGAQNGRVSAARALAALDAGDSEGSLLLSRPALTFSAAKGRVPRAQTIDLRADGGGATAWAAKSDAPWILLSVDHGVTPARLSVRIDPTRLGPLVPFGSPGSGDQLGHVRFGDAVSLEVRVRAGARQAIAVSGIDCALRGAVLHVRAGTACSLNADGVESAPTIQWRLPGGALQTGAQLHAQFVRKGEFDLLVSFDEGAVDTVHVSVE